MADRNPATLEEARAFAAYLESLFMPWDIEARLCLLVLLTIVSYDLATCRNFVAKRDWKSCSAGTVTEEVTRLLPRVEVLAREHDVQI